MSRKKVDALNICNQKLIQQIYFVVILTFWKHAIGNRWTCLCTIVLIRNHFLFNSSNDLKLRRFKFLLTSVVLFVLVN